MKHANVTKLNELFNVDGPDLIEICDDYEPLNKSTIVTWNSGTKGLTTCPDHQKEINRQMMLKRYAEGLDVKGANNPRSKTWRIVYDDGREIIIGALQRWAIDNGYSRSGVKNLAYGKWKRYRDLVTIEEVAQESPSTESEPVSL
jgi:hypothetical protein